MTKNYITSLQNNTYIIHEYIAIAWFMLKKNIRYQTTEGPRITKILGLEKNRVTPNLC